MIEAHSPATKKYFFFFFLLVMGSVITYYLREIIPSVLGAFTLFIVFKNWYVELEKKKIKPSVASVLLLLFIFVIILIPTGFISAMVSDKLINFVNHSEEYFDGLKKLNRQLESHIGIDLMDDGMIQSLKTQASGFFTTLINSTLNLFSVIVMLFFILYFLFIHHEKIEKVVYEYMPFSDKNTRSILTEVKSKVFSNAILIPMVALLQGAMSYIGYLIFGVNEPFFWAVISAFASLLPVVGTAMIWMPISVFLLLQGQMWQGIGLLLFGAIAITSSDNLFRILLQKKFSDEHPMVTILGIIIGLPMFGFIGLIFGPLFISVFLLLTNIYRKEYMKKYRTYKPDEDLVF